MPAVAFVPFFVSAAPKPIPLTPTVATFSASRQPLVACHHSLAACHHSLAESPNSLRHPPSLPSPPAITPFAAWHHSLRHLPSLPSHRSAIRPPSTSNECGRPPSSTLCWRGKTSLCLGKTSLCPCKKSERRGKTTLYPCKKSEWRGMISEIQGLQCTNQPMQYSFRTLKRKKPRWRGRI